MPEKPIINRAWAMPNKWTFQIKPIAELLSRYVGDGKGWIDPFAGMSVLAELTNDCDMMKPSKFHMLADGFCESLTGIYEGVLFDPPYSYRQVSEAYRGFGLKATTLDTSSNFYNRCMNAICDKIKVGGYAISLGWNSNGFGENRQFEKIEILLVAHGGHHNDTIITVEKKIQGDLTQGSPNFEADSL
jgi:hypothetical protein